MANNISKPEISTAITPFLTVKNGTKAIEFYITGLGATEIARYNRPDGKLTAKLAIGSAGFWIGDEEPEFDNCAPETIGGSPVRITLTISDPNIVFARALKAGAVQICPVTTEEFWKKFKLSQYLKRGIFAT